MKKTFLTLITILIVSCTQTNSKANSENNCDSDPEYFLLRPEVEKGFGYSHAVKICNQIKISGAVSMDESANPTAVGDMEQQMKNCYADLKKVLDHYNATFDDVVVENIFTTDMNRFLENGVKIKSSFSNYKERKSLSNICQYRCNILKIFC